MTIDKKEIITLPKWLVIVLLPSIISAIVTLSMVSLYAGGITEKVKKSESEIELLNKNKFDRNEANLMLNSLNRIENKLDSYISNNK